MKLRYLVEITDPHTHMVKVKINAVRERETSNLKFFLPSWSPGSYLMREYARNIRSIRAFNAGGEFLHLEQTSKNVWELDFEKSQVKTESVEFSLEYEIFCHELTVRTSHVDYSHAFLHGPSYLMGVLERPMEEPEIEFKFPGLWSKLHTGLKDISEKRSSFVYTAKNYDELIDAPVEIGCHESDGFMHQGKEHHVIWYGDQYPHKQDLKKDMQTIVETVSSHFKGDLPYDNYLFITHFIKDLYGGLEHLNSTALQFDGRKLNNRKDYLNWMALVAHEYFHTWNVKRIRPKELGPFDYVSEGYTRMHWLTEGLTSFMDDLFVYRAGLSSLEEYLGIIKDFLNKYFSIPGKKFHSLEESSFNAWVKLYRPDENSNNSSISYYLKGGLVFSTLHFDLKKKGKSVNDLLDALWKRYLANPSEGVESFEVLDMIEKIGGKDVRELFEMRISTTEDIDFESYYKEAGCEFVWDETPAPYLGANLLFQGDRAFVESVTLDSPAHKAGLNAGDEILAIDRIRFLKDDADKFEEMLLPDQKYDFSIARLGKIFNVEIRAQKRPKLLKEIKVADRTKAQEVFR
ncbi:MAG: PDZ domain-containing protein [Bacteriovoracaceae bacterium]